MCEGCQLIGLPLWLATVCRLSLSHTRRRACLQSTYGERAAVGGCERLSLANQSARAGGTARTTPAGPTYSSTRLLG